MKRAVRTAALVASSALVLQLLVLPEPAFASQVTAVVTDKVVHMAAFGLLALLLWVLAGGRFALGIFAAVVGVGMLDELHQAFLPGREPDFADLMADAAGAAMALYLVKFLPSGAPSCVES